MAGVQEFLDGLVPQSLIYSKVQEYVFRRADLSCQEWLKDIKELVSVPDEVRTGFTKQDVSASPKHVLCRDGAFGGGESVQAQL
jgi:hypothetical protein